MMQLRPKQEAYLKALRRHKKAKEIAKSDNQSVGDFSGIKSSFRDEVDTKELNSWMRLAAD